MRIILRSVSALTTSVGILALSVKKEDGMGKDIVNSLEGTSLRYEVVSVGFSLILLALV